MTTESKRSRKHRADNDGSSGEWKKSKEDSKEIIINRAKCTLCNDIIESKYVHDFVQCKCGKIFVDGGHEYRRAGFERPSDILLWNEEKQVFETLKSA